MIKTKESANMPTTADDKAATSPALRTGKTVRTREEKLTAERERLIAALANGAADKLLERVAFLLSRFPATRNSDIALQLEYWKAYEAESYARLLHSPIALYQLTRLTSIARSRAKIQNTFRLFQAKEEIRRRRGTLSEEERERQALEESPGEILTVYADESGRTDPLFVVGSVWFVDPRDTFSLPIKVAAWRRANAFDGEFHFTELTRHTLTKFQAFVDLIIGAAPLVSFKSIAVPRAGIRHPDAAFERLFLELLRRGVAHEHSTGRAPLPRRLFLVKDETEAGADRLFLSQLRDQLSLAFQSEFGGRLVIDALEATNSRDQPLLQLADLYASSVNRVLARFASSAKPKDIFADFMLSRVGSLAGQDSDVALPTVGDAASDLHVHIRL